MISFAGSSVMATPNVSDEKCYQSGQTPWSYKYGQDRTSVTAPPAISGTQLIPKVPSNASVSTTVFSQESAQTTYSLFFHEALQATLVSTRPQYDLGIFSKLLLDVLSTASPLESLKVSNIEKIFSMLLTEIQFQEITRLYTFRDRIQVLHVLKRNTFLRQILVETYNNIMSQFPGSQAIIEPIVDCENFNQDFEMMDNVVLMISIVTPLPPQEAMENLSKFYSNWWSKASRKTNRKVSIGLEFV